MNEFENIQRLLRLKQYETPGDDFVESFVTQLHQRQRSEMLRQSARGLLWERVNTFFSDLVSPKWVTAGATAAFAVFAAWGTLGLVGSGSRTGPDFTLASAEALPALLQTQPSFAVESELIKEAKLQDEPLEIEGIFLSHHFGGDELAATMPSSLTPGELTPISAELLPISEFGR